MFRASVMECGNFMLLLLLQSAITFLSVDLMLLVIGVWILLTSAATQKEFLMPRNFHQPESEQSAGFESHLRAVLRPHPRAP